MREFVTGGGGPRTIVALLLLGQPGVVGDGLLGQAVIFGAAHTGPDFTGSALPVVLAIAAAGLLAGLIVRRTGSLLLPILVHIAFDVPLYYAVACRLPQG